MKDPVCLMSVDLREARAKKARLLPNAAKGPSSREHRAWHKAPLRRQDVRRDPCERLRCTW